ncbi:sugar transferase [Ramlibacter pinisoli]|uniref:sugar transferase n=1 Tax=Ramlibacter sp. CGMCC 1.13660 TaxID=2755558 RepID=UPI002106F0F8|nr:sugar transferase [Ramlibacter sp. CGMCC 1.13660]
MKRAVDIFGSIFLIVLLLPMIVVVAIGVRLSSSGPIFYAQTRSGRGGRHFQFYKFRSMKVNSEDVLADFLNSDPEAKKRWDQYQKIDNDPRITAFGRFIRRTSLDELPQFWNVLRGDMSLVGPRPCMLQQKELYGRYWRAYCAVKPGITGLWQVSGRNRLTYEERVRLDVQYVRNLSAWGDIKLLAKTIKVVLSAHGAH